MHFLELPKIKISDIKRLKKAEQWGAYFSGKYTDKDMEVLAMNNPVIKQALDYEAYFNSNDELRKEYLAREEAILDERIRHGYSHQQGIVKGIEKNKIETATNALKEGLSPELIAKITNLSIEEVNRLRQQLNK